MSNDPAIKEQEIQELQNQVNELERQLLEAQVLNNTSSSLARLSANNPNPVLRVSTEGIILYRNPVAAKLTGWRCETNELLPMPLRRLVQQALTENRLVEQDVLLDGKCYAVSVVPVSEECCLILKMVLLKITLPDCPTHLLLLEIL